MDFANFSWQSQISSLNVKLHSSYIDLMPVKITKLQNNSTEEIEICQHLILSFKGLPYLHVQYSVVFIVYISYILQVLPF